MTDQITDQQVQSLVVFFQLALLNQDLAEEAAQAAYLQISAQSKARPGAKDPQPFEILFVRHTDRILRSYRKTTSWKKQAAAHAKNASAPVKQSALIHEAHHLDLSPWRDYFKNAHLDEVTVMIWNHILKVNEDQIADALDLSVGTVRHRLSRGLRSLSQRLEQPQPTLMQRKPWS